MTPDTSTGLGLLACLAVLTVGYLLFAVGPISDTRDSDSDDEDDTDEDDFDVLV